MKMDEGTQHTTRDRERERSDRSVLIEGDRRVQPGG